MTDFSVVIISYNGKDFLRRCLTVIIKSTISPKKIIVVDDCSDDGTEEMVKNEFSFVDFVRNEKNLGPTVSRNRGAELAEGKYIIFLDNDALVRSETLEALVSFLEIHPEIGIVGAKMILENGETMWWNMGYDPNFLRASIGTLLGSLLKFFKESIWLKKLTLKFTLNFWDYDQVKEVDWVVESCFIIRKTLFDELGGFDERYFMYFEGPDLCKRVRQKGYRVYFHPEAKVDLLEGHTHTSLKRVYERFKSELLFYKKHYF